LSSTNKLRERREERKPPLTVTAVKQLWQP
jgi:hypothetical protein